MILARLVSGVVGLLLFTLAMPAASRADVRWLCHPSAGAREDACEQALDTTAIAADGTRSVARPSRGAQRRRPVDCFYVYPTVSNQTTPNATKAADPEIVAVTQYQASRFSRVCRMFVPLYRQVTLADIAGNTVPNGPITIAYADVLEAWRSYLAHDNHGRGVILLGHSQGSILVRQLVRTQIDPDPALRARLVGATLPGGTVTVRDGRTTGGDFQHIPLCKRRARTATSSPTAVPAEGSSRGTPPTYRSSFRWRHWKRRHVAALRRSSFTALRQQEDRIARHPHHRQPSSA